MVEQARRRQQFRFRRPITRPTGMGPFAAGAAMAEALSQQLAQILAAALTQPAIQPPGRGRRRLRWARRQRGEHHRLPERLPPGLQGGPLAVAPGHQGVTGPGQSLQQGALPQPSQLGGGGGPIAAGE